MKLSGQIALVTGVGNAVGQACALRLAGEGARVLATDISAERATAVAASIVGQGREGFATQLDTTHEDHWMRVMRQCLDELGGLDLLVNAAQDFRRCSIDELDVLGFDSAFESAAVGTWLGMKHGIQAMRTTGGGSITNVTTVLARVAAADCAASCAAARGVLMATKSAALECAKTKSSILVNAVLAGRIDGDADHFPDATVLPNAPVVAPDEVAAAVLFLATDGAGYMTGTELVVDGGFLAT